MNGERLTILQGDCLEKLRTLPDESIHCCVTSPPYWGLRDYGVAGQIGLEKSPEEYVAKMVEVFREVRRVLREDGVLFLNLGDAYWGGGNYRGLNSENTLTEKQRSNRGAHGTCQQLGAVGKTTRWNLKPKDLCGIPWRVAFALQADGWYLRSDIIWAKPNPMPESVTDRPTKAHEYLFLLAKSERYFYDAEAIKEPPALATIERAEYGFRNAGKTLATVEAGNYQRSAAEFNTDLADKIRNGEYTGRNRRSVWTIPTSPYPESHFATFPPDLVKPCILAATSAKGCCPKCGAPWERIVERSGGSIGHSWHDHSVDLEQGQRITDSTAKGSISRCKDSNGEEYKVRTTGWQPTCDCGEPSAVPCTVADPFAGSFTTCQVALELGRHAIGIELNPQYVELGRKRCDVTPGLPLA